MKPMARKRSRSRNRLDTTAARFFTRRPQAGLARQSPKTPETMARYKQLLADNLTTPMKMEIMIADADGKNTRQITDFGCASFAPTFTPDGKKILFASNKNECDGRKFELFLINVDGTGLEQVTDFGGFTSFPNFLRMGRRSCFCSDREAKERYEFNIFTADWK
jgi:Tol biopolymer transport system component